MISENAKEFIIILLCIATFLDSAFFRNEAGLPLDLILDSLLVLDFMWKSCRSQTYWKESNYHVLFDVVMIILIVSYSIVEIQRESSFEGLDDAEASLVILRFGTRLIYTCRRVCVHRMCRKRHVRVASDDFCIAPNLEEGACWEIIEDTHRRVCRALHVEDPVVLHRSSVDFSFETLRLHTSMATDDTPCILWLRSGTRLIGFYRERPWNAENCDSAPSLRILVVQNKQYDFLPDLNISFVKCNRGTISISTDASSYLFQESLQTVTENDGKGVTTLSNMSDIEIVSYKRLESMHLTPV